MEATTNNQASQYQVDLPAFSGPLDLLLYLIRKEEVNIYDIPISRITKQYLKYIELMQELNLEVAGEFVLMAATLIRIKARLLLPRDENEPDEVDPRDELIMALIEYKKYREAGEILKEKALIEERNFVPPSPVERIKGRVDIYMETTLFDLLAAFQDVITARHDDAIHQVATEPVSIEERIAVILQLLQQREFASFVELFADIPRKIVAIVTFIAVLELVRTHRIRVHQLVPFGEVRVYRGELFSVPIEIETTALTTEPNEQAVG